MSREKAYETALRARDAAEARARRHGMTESDARDLSRKAAEHVEKSVNKSTTSTTSEKP